jgi:hypothetical protein
MSAQTKRAPWPTRNGEWSIGGGAATVSAPLVELAPRPAPVAKAPRLAPVHRPNCVCAACCEARLAQKQAARAARAAGTRVSVAHVRGLAYVVLVLAVLAFFGLMIYTFGGIGLLAAIGMLVGTRRAVRKTRARTAAEPSPLVEERKRRAIPERVRHEVWRRDEGRCVDCGSRDRLEFDHIIPFSKGGSDTARNLELRCESCNRRKAAKI